MCRSFHVYHRQRNTFHKNKFLPAHKWISKKCYFIHIHMHTHTHTKRDVYESVSNTYSRRQKKFPKLFTIPSFNKLGNFF